VNNEGVAIDTICHDLPAPLRAEITAAQGVGIR
jgi:hypothetical protein